MAAETTILILLSLIIQPLLGGSQGLPRFNNNTDQESLLAFKSEISRDPLGVLGTWNLSASFCNWTGVTCNVTKQRVTGINLKNHGLVGIIAPHIGNLSFLNYLNLQNNSFLGNLPQEMGQLFRLRTLILGSNQIQGTIPSSLSLCTRLTLLDLSINRLQGTIPKELGSLSELQDVSLAQNFLTGPIPSSFVNLSSLTNLILMSNGLHGQIPEGLGHLPFLINLQVGLNSISGEIPPSLFNSSSLIALAMAGNRLTGTLPPDMFTTLTSLTTLYLGGNLLSGRIPPSLGNASNLVRVDLSNNSFSGQIPLQWNLPNIQILSLQINKLVNAGNMDFITSLANSTQLQVFSVAENQLTGKLPSSIGNLSRQLSLLVMNNNFFEGSLPGELSNLINLTLIAFERNSLSGSIPPSIGSLPNLQNIYLHQNKFSGEIPESLGNLTYLSEVHLSNNFLEGTIPATLGDCQRLQLLDLSVNLLNGTIPRYIFGIPSFGMILNLSFNSLSGFVPAEVGNLNMIQAIDMANNEISGDIPVTIGDCSSLLYLNMSRNSFQGTIPNSLAKLKGIEYIDLSSNKLTGVIPTSLETLKFLQVLNLSRNQLSGEVPKAGVFRNSTGVSLSGNLKLCGGVPDLGLPKCDSPGKHSGDSKVKIILIALFASVAFIIISMLVLWSVRKKWSGVLEDNDDANSPEGHPRYRHHDLKLATRNFSSEYLIGEGSFGSVYKGIFRDGSLAAIKVFKMGQHGASKSFLAECKALRNIRHRNLVKIISVCSAGDFKALVLPFMPNGNLEQLLHPRSENCEVEKALDINLRLKIAQDVASALAYLHHDCETPVVHCDLKPSNVLLDGEMVAHVGDFGLARILLKNSPKADLSSSLGLKGSIGYMAPEYGIGAGASTRGDVYSFGILILELFTRKRPTDNLFTGDMDFQKWVSMHLPDNLLDIVDHELLQNEWQPAHSDGIATVINFGLMCARKSPEERPTMREVSAMIENVKAKLSE
ncbi:PREDICTED: putative receptor-like protein kinase At3g47110 [Theobroma cacao]|uniref:non-specific serine/threonine protein kinase n=1 Tax=Theobroma cacao TaxID=3641 RepID=A0AB32WBX2_THECC|nr:PREDICTED: putative receptor-like protein kinase At3g47110 [Theobroma cacao]